MIHVSVKLHLFLHYLHTLLSTHIYHDVQIKNHTLHVLHINVYEIRDFK